jgi:hypothetical protein
MEVVKYGDYFARQGWYPSSESGCRAAIEQYAQGGALPAEATEGLSGGVVPHAGWTFSGSLAAKVFRALGQGAKPDLLVLFGGHMGPSSKAWVWGQGVWPTPLGEMPGDPQFAAALAEKATDLAPALLGPADYQPDNTIELQLPFARYFLGETKLVVAGVPASPQGLALGTVAAELAAEQNINAVCVGSTDLTHYGINYGFTPKGVGTEAVRWVKEENDHRALQNLENMDPQRFLQDGLELRNACCPGAAGAAMQFGAQKGAQAARILGYRTSYDIHPGSSFVGYVAATF